MSGKSGSTARRTIVEAWKKSRPSKGARAAIRKAFSQVKNKKTK